MSTAAAQSHAFNAGIVIDMNRNWQCNSCGRLHVTAASTEVQTPLHQCPSHAGTWVPFVPAHSTDRIRLSEREDYVGSDTPFFDANGRPIMSVYTMREDGEDCHILAPTINVKLSND